MCEKTKICVLCKVEKYLSEFYKHKSGRHGVDNRCKICFTAYRKDYYKDKPEKLREIKVKCLYGLEADEYKKLKKDQKNICKICGKKTKLYVDHNHDTGKVRGLLCHKCNTGIGLLNDNLELLEKAVKYLKENDG